MEKLMIRFSILLFAVSLSACTIINRTSSPPVSTQANWAVVPFANNTETPMAGERARAITTSLLQARGVHHFKHFQAKRASRQFLPTTAKPLNRSQLLKWGRRHDVQYVVTGTVNEWRYKVGIDGEPAVGLTLQVWDVSAGRVIWNAAGGKTGNTHQGLSEVGQRLIGRTLGGLHIVV